MCIFEQVDKSGMVTTGFFQCNNYLFREITYATNQQCCHMYMALLSHRNSVTNQCFPSYELLANETNQSVSSVKRQINKLYENGYILINSGKHGICNNYYFPKEEWFKSSMDSDLANRRSNVMSDDLDKQLKKAKKSKKIIHINKKLG